MMQGQNDIKLVGLP